jgi:hypothetical protein
MYSFYFFVYFFVLFYTFNYIHTDDQVKVKVKKDPRDFTENDVNNLFEQWEVIFIL